MTHIFFQKIPFFIAIFLFLISACGDEKTTSSSKMDTVEPTLTATNPILDLLPASKTGIDFQNQIIESYENNITTNINMYNGGGMAVADINNDGLQDIYFISSSGKNRMYLNEGGMKFKDITDAAGLGSEGGFETSVTAVDLNADGFLDFYICRAGVEHNEQRKNKLFINNQNLTFSEKSAEYGLEDGAACTGANFFDMDNDGDLDCYILHYPTQEIYTNKIEAKLAPDGKTYIPQLFPKVPEDSHKMMRNDGGKFVDISEKSGIWNLAYGLSVSVTDFNHDGFTDIYVGNDFIQPDLLYINNRNGTFTNRLPEYFTHTSQHTMGTDLTDFDNDGFVDLYAVDMLAANNARRKSFMATNTLAKYTSQVQHGYFEPVVQNVLQRNNGNGTFSDIGCIAGVYQTDWSWSGLIADFNNDGLRDIHVTNGYRREVTNRDFIDFTLPEIQKKSAGKRLRDIYPNFHDFLDLVPSFKVRNFMFGNQGNWQFSDESGKWMTMPASWSCGSSWADLDNDGDLDLAVNNLEEPAFIYENKTAGTAGANYLQVKLKGSSQNLFAVGASVMIFYENGKQQYAENFPTRGIFSSVEHLVHFGLGSVGQVQKLVVRWPDGKAQTLENVAVNQRLTLEQKNGTGYVAALLPPSANPIFTEKTAGSGLESFLHEEDEFLDFEKFFLNPWKVTELGPLLTKGDVNGDGLEDFFVGNTFDKPAAIFVQSAGGKFARTNQAFLESEKIYEDHGGLFFDADGDKDQDLFVISGGAEAVSPLAWSPRLYLNDGKGNFSKSQLPLPQIDDVALRADAHDFDGDGDLDLFIGGRVTPGKWPLTPKSRIFRNEGKGRFLDVSAGVGGDFSSCGMVTDLKWVNLDSDPALELVVVGEWMPVSIFKFQGGKMTNVTANFGLEKSNGLWFRLLAADLDGDGDTDLATGNMGLNTRYVAGADSPMRCFAKDFDKNGSLDPLMAYFENGKMWPFAQKDVLVKQMPILKKKFLFAKDYSMATVDQIFTQPELDEALNLFVYNLASGWWENQNGKFVFHQFPNQAQTFPMQGILADDFTGDGKIDLVLAGNKYGMEVETNRCDSGIGTLLSGDGLASGESGFSWIDNRQSGFWARNEVRDLMQIGRGGQAKIVVSANHDRLKIFGKK